MQTILKNRLLVTIMALALMFLSYVIYLLFFREALQPLLETIPLPRPVTGTALAFLLGTPGAIFGIANNAYGTSSKSSKS